jgi:hypothetical protein
MKPRTSLFRESTSRFLPALDDQEPLLGSSATKEPFGQPAFTKRSVGAKNQNVHAGGSSAARLGKKRILASAVQTISLNGGGFCDF